MFRLAHLSDIHLGPLPEVTYRDLASKRITGYINWQRSRRKLMHEGVLGVIVDAVRAERPDHIVITGDLVNLALDAEIEIARQWLEEFGTPDQVTVVPGNHDAYVPGALDKVCRAWGPWMAGDDATGPVSRDSFPFCRVRGPVALLGVSSARASAPFMASGFFRERQAEILGRLLDAADRRGLFRAVLIHHPPVRGAAPTHKRLFGIGLFQKLMRRHGAELVLHGHTHEPTHFHIPGRHGDVAVIGVSAATQGLEGHRHPAQFNLFEIGGSHGCWSVRLTRFGLSGHSSGVTAVASETFGIARPGLAASA
jgi:3',5'-cyclic AMP phosphodiesterase CpdA